MASFLINRGKIIIESEIRGKNAIAPSYIGFETKEEPIMP